MNYSMLVSDECEKNIRKLCRKNNSLREILKRKMNEIIENPNHYKPLIAEVNKISKEIGK